MSTHTHTFISDTSKTSYKSDYGVEITFLSIISTYKYNLKFVVRENSMQSRYIHIKIFKHGS